MWKMFRSIACTLALATLLGCAPASSPSPTPAAPTPVPMPVSTPTQIPPTVSPPTQTPSPVSTPTRSPVSTSTPTEVAVPTPNDQAGVRKIKHVIVIMQENRSFDQYFGTYPGADGIPMQNGVPTICVNDPKTQQCVKPYHDSRDVNAGGPHAQSSATSDVDGGKMDGFIASFRRAQRACKNPDTPGCVSGQSPDVMGWHDAREIPNYWAYAQNFVLQDRMFEPNASWSLPSHLFLVSAWSAKCSTPGDPNSCVNATNGPSGLNVSKNDYAWTDLTYLLHRANVSWAYYLSEGSEPDCSDDAMLCEAKPQNRNVPGIWNPLPAFDTVKQDDQLPRFGPKQA